MADEIAPELALLADKLAAVSVGQKLLPGRAVRGAKPDLVRSDYIRLLNEASILALSADSRARMLAYDIVTHSLALRSKDQPGLLHSVDFILSRLANFPGRRLLRQHHHAVFDGNPGSAVPLLLEALIRERENTVAGFGHALTDFQYEFFHALETQAAVSISAPTSAGKSFVLGQHIIRKVRTIRGCCVIYIVPTRALIREVMLRLRKELAESNVNGVAQRCVPLPATEEETPHGLIYVLTQERLLSLLHLSGDSFRVNLLVIDEAQGVRDGSRGVLLQTAVEQSLLRCPQADVVFASPLIRNPLRFLELFTHSRGYSALERHSPVGQNFILVESDSREPTHLNFALLRHGTRVPLGSRELLENFRRMGSLLQRAFLSVAVTNENESCLVYANGPWEAEQLADRLVQLRPTASVGQEVLDFISYIEEHIHPEYPLITALRRGIAFHHGEMPASVRGGVEDLFRLRKLQFICCTSTLLQGVNLPARHLVVDRPRRGNGMPLQPADFLNLAGRAGRLGREFNGNVWCLNASVWPNPPQDQTELPNVEAAFETTVKDDPERIVEVLDGARNVDRDGVVTASIGRLLTEYVFTGRLPSLPEDEAKRIELLKAIAAIKGLELRLPKRVFIRNSTVLPKSLERLYLSLLSQPDLDLWIPLHPHHDEFFNSLARIFEFLQIELEERKGLRFKFDASLAVKWIRQWPLRRIIEARLEWQQKNGKPGSPQSTIRSIIQAVERRMRFELVRSLRAYNDVLEVVLAEKGRAGEIEALRPLYLYIECGGFKQSLLSLMSLGFSRTSALILLDSLNVPDGLRPEQCRERILRLNLNAAKVPELVQREVRQLLGARIRKMTG